MITDDKIKHTKLPFIVESGNWKLKILFSPVDNELNSLTYAEACTRAFEYIFGNGTEDDIQLLSIKDKNGKEYVDIYYKGETNDDIKYNYPDAVYGVYTSCRLEDDENNKDKWWYFLSSVIFKNAGNVEYIINAEENEYKFKSYIDKLNKVKKSTKTPTSKTKTKKKRG